MVRHYLGTIAACVLVFGCSAEVDSGAIKEDAENVNPDQATLRPGQNVVSAEVASALARRLEAMDIVATTITSTGEIFDWVPIESQTQDGAIATPPAAPYAADVESMTTALQSEPDKLGPPGTVPVLRPDLSKINAPGSAQAFFSKYGTPGDAGFIGEMERQNLPALDGAERKRPLTFLGLFPGDHMYVGTNRAVTNYGFDSKINVWDPFVTQGTLPNGEFSLAQGAVFRGSGIGLQTVEAGWLEYPAKFGDPFPHLFTYYTTNGYTSMGNNVGGYNREVTGWVQVSTTVAPGIRLTPTSTVGIANQREIALSVWLSGGNWWVWYINQWIGYYPGTLFATTGLRNQASMVGFQGEVVDETTFIATSTDMGSGKFASTGWGNAAYMRHLQYLTAPNGVSPVRYSPTTTAVSNSNCYSHLAQYTSTDPNFLSSFFFGGPGYNTNCQF
jgi:hypothetical protein